MQDLIQKNEELKQQMALKDKKLIKEISQSTKFKKALQERIQAQSGSNQSCAQSQMSYSSFQG